MAYTVHLLRHREPAINLSEDLVRTYEAKWWQAAREVRCLPCSLCLLEGHRLVCPRFNLRTPCPQADLPTLGKMLGGGKDALAMVVDENSRRCDST